MDAAVGLKNKQPRVFHEVVFEGGQEVVILQHCFTLLQLHLQHSQQPKKMTLESHHCVGGINLVCCEDEGSADRLPVASNADSTVHIVLPLHVLNLLLSKKLRTCCINEVSKLL